MQFLKIDSITENVLRRMSDIEEASSMGVCSLEIEKEKMKMEIGSCSAVRLKEEMDRSSLWQAIGWTSSEGSEGEGSHISSGDLASFRIFENWARSQVANLRKAMS